MAHQIGKLIELFLILYTIPVLFSFATAVKFYSGYKKLGFSKEQNKRSWISTLFFPLDISFEQYLKLVMPFTYLSGEGAKTRLAASIIQVLCAVMPFVIPFIINGLP